MATCGHNKSVLRAKQKCIGSVSSHAWKIPLLLNLWLALFSVLLVLKVDIQSKTGNCLGFLTIAFLSVFLCRLNGLWLAIAKENTSTKHQNEHRPTQSKGNEKYVVTLIISTQAADRRHVIKRVIAFHSRKKKTARFKAIMTVLCILTVLLVLFLLLLLAGDVERNPGPVVMEHHIPKLLSLLIPISDRWEFFLGQLKSDISCGVIRSQYEHSSEFAKSCLSKGLSEWQLSEKNPTFENIARVLHGNVVNDVQLATKVELFAIEFQPHHLNKLINIFLSPVMSHWKTIASNLDVSVDEDLPTTDEDGLISSLDSWLKEGAKKRESCLLGDLCAALRKDGIPDGDSVACEIESYDWKENTGTGSNRFIRESIMPIINSLNWEIVCNQLFVDQEEIYQIKQAPQYSGNEARLNAGLMCWLDLKGSPETPDEIEARVNELIKVVDQIDHTKHMKLQLLQLTPNIDKLPEIQFDKLKGIKTKELDSYSIQEAVYDENKCLFVRLDQDPRKHRLVLQMQQVDCKNLPKLIGYFQKDSQYYIVFESMQNLVDFCAPDNKICEQTQLRLLIDVVQGVCKLETLGLNITRNSVFVRHIGDVQHAVFCPFVEESTIGGRVTDDLQWLDDIAKCLCLQHKHGQLSVDHPLVNFLPNIVSSCKEPISMQDLSKILHQLEWYHDLLKTRNTIVEILSGDLVEFKHLHLILIGHCRVGKTSILKHLKNEPIDPKQNSTVVVDHELLQCETLHGNQFVFKPYQWLKELDSSQLCLTVWDTGGQPMYQDLIQCFSQLRSVFGIVFRLIDAVDFNQRPDISFGEDGEETRIKPCPFSNEQLVHHCYAYVQSFSSDNYVNDILRHIPPEVQSNMKLSAERLRVSGFPKTALIGTHLDRVDDSNRSKVNSVLRKLETSLEELVIGSKPCKCLLRPDLQQKSVAFKLNNLKSGSTEVDAGMANLRKRLSEYARSIAVPDSVYAFKASLELYCVNKHPDRGFLKYEEVAKLATDCDILTVNAHLCFLHLLGLIIWYYYSSSESCLKDYVIVFPNKLPEALSLLLDAKEISGDFSYEWHTLLRKRGFLEESLANELLKEADSKGLLPMKWLLEFLKEHSLAIKTKLQHQLTEYTGHYLPLMMDYAPNPKSIANKYAATLYIVSKSVCFSPVLFSKLMVQLINTPNWNFSGDVRLCRNVVNFQVNGYYRVELLQHSNFFEVNCHPDDLCDPDSKKVDSDFCIFVQQTLSNKMHKIIRADDPKDLFRFSFACQRRNKPLHFLRGDIDTNGPKKALPCPNGHFNDLGARHSIWFSRDSSVVRDLDNVKAKDLDYGCFPDISVQDFDNYVASVRPAQWYSFAVQAGLDTGRLNAIQGENSTDKLRFLTIYGLWEKKDSITWNQVINILCSKSVAEPRLALNIYDKLTQVHYSHEEF